MGLRLRASAIWRRCAQLAGGWDAQVDALARN